MTRTGETLDFPKRPCKAGIMVNVRFPTCWDGVNLDSPDHMSHVAYVRFCPPFFSILPVSPFPPLLSLSKTKSLRQDDLPPFAFSRK
jgi:hypothetical protein